MSRAYFILFSLVITLLPAVAIFLNLGSYASFYFLTGDAYLYLGIAENSNGGYYSFDGEEPTNGFHPLWQFILWAANLIYTDQIQLMNFSAWATIFLVLIGVLTLGFAIARMTGSWWLATLATPGVYFLFVGQGIQNLSVWNFFSGMEAGLVFTITGLIALTISYMKADETRLSRWIILGTLFGILMLARLDEVFVPLLVGLVWLFWEPRGFVQKLPRFVLLGVPAAVMLVAFWLYNLSNLGMLMPISGAAKGEGALISSIWVTLAVFIGPLVDLREAFTSYTAAHSALYGASFRVAEVIFPAIASVFFVIIIRRNFRDSSWAPYVVGLCAGVVAKSIYNFLFVNYWHQSDWYFGFACAVITLATALVIAPTIHKLRETNFVAFFFVATLVALVSLFQASQRYYSKTLDNNAAERIAFWDSRQVTEDKINAASPGSKIIEFGDGMLNYAFKRPVRHGFVFAGDPDSLTALQTQSLLSDAFNDGYSILSSYEYLRWPEASVTKTSDEIRTFLERSFLDGRVKAELTKFDYEVVAVYEPLGIPFILLTPN